MDNLHCLYLVGSNRQSLGSSPPTAPLPAVGRRLCPPVRRPRLSPSLAPPGFFWARLTPIQDAGACDKPAPLHPDFTISLGDIAIAVAFVCPSTPALCLLELSTTQGTLFTSSDFRYPPQQPIATPRRAPSVSYAIPLRAPANRLDLSVGTACLPLKLLGALQTSDGPSFGAKSQRLPEPQFPWRIPNAALEAKAVFISIITKVSDLFSAAHKLRRWRLASVSQDDFFSYFITTARSIRLSVGSSNIRRIYVVYAATVTWPRMMRTAAGTSQRETLTLLLSPLLEMLYKWNLISNSDV
ncbi:hypothetical protein CORC01_04945 [Colletotrichum orchidophilum]|uniref:Uncharacterized protein n=1 Tax=Colletotrichum orchidophilum TaxID=1209926 RepID=A0A1G4BEB5_9PEZI|nr:uncharacterized protein CORC01_04945 [Colletotrichum orchidophilum]OHE99809.1 hypothetical protein CORC01_04945 [Colletotrichum orchidophilum]